MLKYSRTRKSKNVFRQGNTSVKIKFSFIFFFISLKGVDISF